MGSKLTKSKSLTIENKTNEQQKDAGSTTTELKKQVEKTKNKKKKSLVQRVDKSTNTESCILPTTAYAEQLVGEPIPSAITTTQIKIIKQTDSPSEDVRKLREACLTNGDESTDLADENQETTYRSSIVIITNVDNEQQQQHVES